MKSKKKIISLKESGCSFEEIGTQLGISAKIANANYNYAIQKLAGTIPNKDTVLTEKQEKDIVEALEALKSHLRELKGLEENQKQELSYNPNDLINICQEMADKIGVPFDKEDFI